MCTLYRECCVGRKFAFGDQIPSLFSLVEEDIVLQGDANGVGEKTLVDSDTHQRYRRRISPGAGPVFAEAATANLACGEQGSGISSVNSQKPHTHCVQ